MKLREFLDTIPKEITELRIIATRQQAILEEHIFRTEIAEKKLEMLSGELLGQGKQLIALQAHTEATKSIGRTILKILSGIVVGVIIHTLYK